PMRMHDRLNQIMITDDSGKRVPLVKSDRLVYASKRPTLPAEAPNRVGWFLLIGLVVGGGQAWLSQILKTRNSRVLKSGFLIFSMFWSFLASFAGSFLIYTWTLTDHVWVRNNEIIFQMSALLFPLVILIPLIIRGRRLPLRIAQVLAIIALGASVLGLLLK